MTQISTQRTYHRHDGSTSHDVVVAGIGAVLSFNSFHYPEALCPKFAAKAVRCLTEATDFQAELARIRAALG